MGIPVIQVSQMRQWEKASWAAGRQEDEVISRVGHIVTQRACQMTRPGDLIVVLAGKGHNGDDARQAGRNFSDREVFLIDVTDPGQALEEFSSQLSLQPALLIDGLFGIGLSRPLEGEWIRLVEGVNGSRIPILAIDAPSGLDADSGEARGAAIRATVTLTLAAPKIGLIRASAWEYVGRLETAPDIGLIPDRPSSELQWTEHGDFLDFPLERPVSSHKGTFGHLAVVAGSLGFHGAAVLAARGASRARPGLITVFTPSEVYLPVASQLQAVMVKPWHESGLSGTSPTALLFGPGLADKGLSVSLKKEMTQLWHEAAFPVIADASGLDWLSPSATELPGIRVMTPHPGEAARLLGISASIVQQDRCKAVRELSSRYGHCWVVLKGHQTLIGRSSGPLYVNSSGNPGLAQGGSGDVLAGFLAGFLAQPGIQAAPERALRYSVWKHGATADALSSRMKYWGIEDLALALGS